MKTASVKPLDIELALLVAIFELHRDRLTPENIGGIIRKHLETLEPFYEANAQPPEGNSSFGCPPSEKEFC